MQQLVDGLLGPESPVASRTLQYRVSVAHLVRRRLHNKVSAVHLALLSLISSAPSSVPSADEPSLSSAPNPVPCAGPSVSSLLQCKQCPKLIALYWTEFQ
jgi:hypothetical protein